MVTKGVVELARLLKPMGDADLCIMAVLMAKEEGLIQHLIDYIKDNHITDMDDVFEFIHPGIVRGATTNA